MTSLSGPATHRARKRFGQNFLVDERVVNQIIDAIDAQPSDHLIEIGPGLGILTKPLLEQCPNLTAIEIDTDLANRLAQRFGHLSGFQLHCGDALNADLAALANNHPVRVVGNLPYNISTPLLFYLLSCAAQIRDMHFMLQKEVVNRMAAPPGSKAFGRLSVMIQYASHVQPLMDVPPHAFSPSPKVTSTVVRLIPHAEIPKPANNPQHFAQLVNRCFQQRRKTLRNALKHLVPENAQLATLAVDLNARPETLSVADFVALSNELDSWQ